MNLIVKCYHLPYSQATFDKNSYFTSCYLKVVNQFVDIYLKKIYIYNILNV